MKTVLKNWAVKFVTASLAVIFGLIAVCWAAFGFGALGLDVHGMIALSLGIFFSVGVGVALMALVFYSDRSGRDRDVNRQD